MHGDSPGCCLLLEQRNSPGKAGVPVPCGPAPLSHPFSLQGPRFPTLYSPPPAQVGLRPTAITLCCVVLMPLAHGIQHGEQLGLQGSRHSHAQEPTQRASRQHRQLRQVGRQSQLLEE